MSKARCYCLLALFFVFIAATTGAHARSSHVWRSNWRKSHELRFSSPVISGIRANVVTLDLRSTRLEVRPVVAGQAPCFMKKHYRTFADMVKVTHCVAAINGTFFDPRTASVLGCVAYHGHLMHDGCVGSAVAVDDANQPHYLRLCDRNGPPIDWRAYRFGIGAGVTLVNEGHIVLNPRAEGFHDPHVFRPAKRSAIGFRRNGEMIFVTVPKAVSLSRLAHMMVHLGSNIALNLDGGSSCALYFKGKWVMKPKGKLTNILTVVPRRS